MKTFKEFLMDESSLKDRINSFNKYKPNEKRISSFKKEVKDKTKKSVEDSKKSLKNL